MLEIRVPATAPIPSFANRDVTQEIVVMAIASQGEAEAGADNTKVMTPLRVKQAVTSFSISTILPQISGDTIDLMIFTQGGVAPDRAGTNGSEAVTDAAFADAIDAAETQVAAHVSAGAEIKIPSGAFRIDNPITIDTAKISLNGRGHGATAIITDSAAIDMVKFDGGASGNGIVNNGLQGVSLIRVGTMPTGGAASPKQLYLRNVRQPRFSDLFFEKASIGIYGERLVSAMFSQIWMHGTQNSTAGYAAVWLTSTSTQQGVSFGNHFTDLEIQNKHGSTDYNWDHGFLVECADGLYIHQGHIHLAKECIRLAPTGIALSGPISITDTLGGVWLDDLYLDTPFEYGIHALGEASSYGRILCQAVRFAAPGKSGIRIGPTAGTTIEDIELDNCLFNDADESAVYVVTGGVEDLKITGSTFRDNNSDNGASDGDIRLAGGDDIFIAGNKHRGGGATGFGISVASAVNGVTIEGNDLSKSTAATKLNVLGQHAGRKIVGNKEYDTSFSEQTREGIGQTTSTTPLLVWSLAVAEDWTVEVDAHAVASHSAKTKAATIRMVAVYNRATGGSLVEEGQTTVWSAEDDPGTNITLVASGNTIEFSVVGLAGITLNWEWNVRYRIRSA